MPGRGRNSGQKKAARFPGKQMHSGATIERVLIAFSRRLMRSANRFILVIAFLTDLLRWQQGRMWHYVFREFDIDP